jgi:hypothetical protein
MPSGPVNRIKKCIIRRVNHVKTKMIIVKRIPAKNMVYSASL